MAKTVRSEYENSRPLDVHRWSDYPEVNKAVNHIYAEIVALGDIKRQKQAMTKKYIKILTLDLYVAHTADPSQYIGYPRNHNELKNDRYNKLFIKTELLVKIVDWFCVLGFAVNKLGHNYPGSKRQSRVRATDKLIDLIKDRFAISPIMIGRHEKTETIILRDENKKKIPDYEETAETICMRDSLKIINGLLDKTLISVYLPDTELAKLNKRMITGELDDGVDEEIPRGAIDYNYRHLHRVFNNGSFDQGGRFYGGWWQGVPREYRKFVKISQMLTVEIDFSGMHINLLYALKGLQMPYDDPYELEGLPAGTREVVKRSLLTVINAKDRTSALQSIRKEIREKKLTLPKGVKKIEEVIDPFEAKHEEIKEYFFSGQGVFLQKEDSKIAEEIMLILAREGIPALPLHDSFIVCFKHEGFLKAAMQQAYMKVTGRATKVDNKTSVIDINKERPIQELEQEQDWKREQILDLSDEFKLKYSQYYRYCKEWKEIVGSDSLFFPKPQVLFNQRVQP